MCSGLKEEEDNAIALQCSLMGDRLAETRRCGPRMVQLTVTGLACAASDVQDKDTDPCLQSLSWQSLSSSRPHKACRPCLQSHTASDSARLSQIQQS